MYWAVQGINDTMVLQRAKLDGTDIETLAIKSRFGRAYTFDTDISVDQNNR